MTINPRWWDAVMAGVLVVCGLLLGLPGDGHNLVVAWSALVGFALVYLLLVRRTLSRQIGTTRQTRPVDVASAALVAVLVGIGVYGDPILGNLQVVAHPLVWTLPWRIRSAIVASTTVAVAVLLGYGLSPATDGWLWAVVVAVLSLAFAVVIGVWISNIAGYGIERARLLAELTAAQDELAAAHRQAGEASERAQLARDLHDTVTQSITGLVMLAERAGTQLRTGEVSDAATSIALVESAAREALSEARALVATMTPVAADSGLADALHRLGSRFERETGVVVEIQVGGHRIAREHEVVLLRCAQEGLANVRKHAHASRVAIEVTADETNDELVLTVRDDGVGIDAGTTADEAGFGVTGMRERVGMLGGHLTLGTRPGGGTELAVAIPLDGGA